jgi:hypothetical protein
MPTDSRTYNSRITTEALEKKFRDTFPSQGGAELVDDLYASGVIVPVVDFSSAAAGATLGTNLQTAWDFSTGHATTSNATATLINNPGFWKVQVNFVGWVNAAVSLEAYLQIDSGVAVKEIWRVDMPVASNSSYATLDSNEMVVFLRSGDSLEAVTDSIYMKLNTVWRQIADVNGNLVNPLGFTSS